MANEKPTHDNPPERLRITKPWEFGDCKRCLSHDTKAGDVIVRIFNRGWWHDDCYRVVNPKFYEGLDGVQA